MSGSTCTLRRHHFYPEPQQQQKETITNNHHHDNKENIKPKVGCVHNHDNQDPENINQFIDYLFTKSQVTRSVFMTSLIYLQRLGGINQKLTESGQPGIIEKHPILACRHCFFLGAIVVAAKYVEDNVLSNVLWSKWAAVSPNHLKRIELAILSTLDFDMKVEPANFAKFVQVYVAACQNQQSNNQPELYQVIARKFVIASLIYIFSYKDNTIHNQLVNLKQQSTTFYQPKISQQQYSEHSSPPPLRTSKHHHQQNHESHYSKVCRYDSGISMPATLTPPLTPDENNIVAYSQSSSKPRTRKASANTYHPYRQQLR